MGQPVSLGQAWAALGPHWQECFELAWRSLRSGGVAIGALLVDGDGDLVGRGRNRRFGASGDGLAEISGLLGHAEMNALMSVPAGKARRRDYCSTRHCSRVRCAPARLSWRDCAVLSSPPLYGPLGVWADILPGLSVFGSMQRSLEARAPARAALAGATASRFRDRDAMPPTTLAALEVIWDELAEASAG